jgi:hypothetical protein
MAPGSPPTPALRYRAAVTPEVLWSPPPDARERSRMGRYLAWLASTGGPRFETYDQAWR